MALLTDGRGGRPLPTGVSRRILALPRIFYWHRHINRNRDEMRTWRHQMPDTRILLRWRREMPSDRPLR